MSMASYTTTPVPEKMETPATRIMWANPHAQPQPGTQSIFQPLNQPQACSSLPSCNMLLRPNTTSAPMTCKCSPETQTGMREEYAKASTSAPFRPLSTAMRAATPSPTATTPSSRKSSKSPALPSPTNRMRPYLTRPEDHQAAHATANKLWLKRTANKLCQK